jgi:ribose 5-phosphate isomerase B
VKIAVGADHAAFEAKEKLRRALEAAGHEVLDCGTQSNETCDYPEFAEAVARAVGGGRCERGFALCGTGIGQSIVANKIPGVRAALVHDEFTTRMSREHNDANVFCAGARVLDADSIVRLARLWLETPFGGGRHVPRIEKIRKLDQR